MSKVQEAVEALVNAVRAQMRDELISTIGGTIPMVADAPRVRVLRGHPMAKTTKETELNASARSVDRKTRASQYKNSKRRILVGAEDGYVRQRPVNGKRFRRDAGGLAAEGEKLLAYVTKYPGKRGEQIGAALGVTAKVMRKPMALLIKARKVRTTGQRRGMTYWPR